MRVLIADDHPDAVEMLAMLVRTWGYDPLTTEDGSTALNLLQAAEGPMLAVLDWLMPGVNGIDICRRLREEPGRPYSYVILMTGRAGKQQMLEGLEAGADDYLLKPVQPTELHARLSTGRRIIQLQEQLLATQRQLREQATRDALTGVWNRAMIHEVLHRELDRSQRLSQPVAVIMADIDYFKSVNDRLGHVVGDQVLRHIGQRLLACLRPYDTVGRYGGEEFLIVLPGCGADRALDLAERLRKCIEDEQLHTDGLTVKVTMSLGVTTWDGQSSEEALVHSADRALYRAKDEGRNRVRAGDLGHQNGERSASSGEPRA
jgi:two-component system, cell cycle response regulator